MEETKTLYRVTRNGTPGETYYGDRKSAMAEFDRAVDEATSEIMRFFGLSSAELEEQAYFGDGYFSFKHGIASDQIFVEEVKATISS